MRTLLLTSSAIVVSVGGFFGYLALHSAPLASVGRDGPVDPQSLKKDALTVVGVAEGDPPWIN